MFFKGSNNLVEIYLKIFVMLYADDTILLAESAEDLQVQLNAFGEYCDNWKMKVNVNTNYIFCQQKFF
jgi:hypothetical protein